ncbi:MAG: beta-galactosidase [Cyclobacteriaceae bacterium]|nr:beta-galactosidase [Cyclobacteriaceae bacterium]
MRHIISAALFLAATCSIAQKRWQPVPDKIVTEWAAQIDPSKPLNEYPRPQLVRNNWVNLNGIWKYVIAPHTKESTPSDFQEDILVPFPIESALSGVGKTVGKENVLRYKRDFSVSSAMRKGKLLLHFGAVDWKCEVFINGKKVGEHLGGYDPFTFDITDAVAKGTSQQLTVKVWDPSDDGPQPRGKQVKKPEGIWYTPVTGIWQTVWLETVPDTYISSTSHIPNIDDATISVTTSVVNLKPDQEIVVTASAGDQMIASDKANEKGEVTLSIPNPRLWSPESPFLYDLRIAITRKGKVIDEVASYFAMRKISLQKDDDGYQRLALNNKNYFQYGPLDQGWWPDGLYTAPTDEALKFDIEKTKELGFNMIRKHVKVEPARWYYHADKLGMLVWQDMPSGDMGGNAWDMRPGIMSGGLLEKERTKESAEIYRKEWSAIVNSLKNFPCIAVWVPFNEAWGQFRTKEIADWTSELDPTRLVNAASGGNFIKGAGEIFDIHNYPDPFMPKAELFGADQALVLGEFGGLGLPIEGHTWQSKDNWGYQTFKSKEELERRYAGMVDALTKLITKGLTAAIYTQTTDVEGEVNGLMTYDRKLIKMDREKLSQSNTRLLQYNK